MSRFTLGSALILAVAIASPALAGPPCFFGKEAFTIESKLTGIESGTLTEYVSDCGRKRVEVKDVVTSMAGMKIKTRQRVIYDGDQIVTINLENGMITQATNPMYADMVEAMGDKSGVEFGQQMLRAMNGRETDETAEHAGHSCRMWELPSVSSVTCVTAWGGTLYSKSSIMGMTSERTAIAVRLGDAGPDDVYQYDASKAKQAPDLGELMKKLQTPRQ